MSQQEALLDAGDGSQVICYCYNDFSEEYASGEILQNADIAIAADEDSLSTYESNNVDATPKTRADISQPLEVKRKDGTISKLSYSDDVGENCTIKKKLFEKSFPEEDEFNNIQKDPIRKWRDISTNITYQVIDMEKVGKNIQEEFNVVSLRSRENEQFKVWLTPRISNNLQKYDLKTKTLFIKSYGLKPCKNSSRSYFDFRVVTKDL